MTKKTASKPERKSARVKTSKVQPSPTPPPSPTIARPKSKIAQVLTLLQSATGADLPQLTKATGWQSHTVRAAITGLRKRGYIITSNKLDGTARRYVASSKGIKEADGRTKR